MNANNGLITASAFHSIMFPKDIYEQLLCSLSALSLLEDDFQLFTHLTGNGCVFFCPSGQIRQC
jgi:hypothetical protein